MGIEFRRLVLDLRFVSYCSRGYVSSSHTPFPRKPCRPRTKMMDKEAGNSLDWCRSYSLLGAKDGLEAFISCQKTPDSA